MIYRVEVTDATSQLRLSFARQDLKAAVRDGKQEAKQYPHTKVSYCQPSVRVYEGETLVYYELCLEET